MKNERGITMVALVLTVVVMLILTGVTINLAIGDSGIITTVREESDNQENAVEQEKAKMNSVLDTVEEDWGID